MESRLVWRSLRKIAPPVAAFASSLRKRESRGFYAHHCVRNSAKTLRELVDFYDRRFQIGYTEREKQDLVNFLSIL